MQTGVVQNFTAFLVDIFRTETCSTMPPRSRFALTWRCHWNWIEMNRNIHCWRHLLIGACERMVRSNRISGKFGKCGFAYDTMCTSIVGYCKFTVGYCKFAYDTTCLSYDNNPNDAHPLWGSRAGTCCYPGFPSVIAILNPSQSMPLLSLICHCHS